MASNLRDRLRRIQEHRRNETSGAECPPIHQGAADISIFTGSGWEVCGFQTLKREVSADAPSALRANLPLALAILVPDFDIKNLPDFKDFLFFDLETTGLSGGAGTVAFLAAFGRLDSGGRMRITQYLLLDYPGENVFIETVLSEFKNEKSVIVSYNGKSFDSQILKTRCLMNGIQPPEYFHADLLHPARRLWKNVTGDCSQGSIETRILGIDRSGDTPGALAPEIWFDFLRTGRTERLFGICDHNLSDITGLTSILAAMISIAADPFAGNYRYDIERFALYWRNFERGKLRCRMRPEEESFPVQEYGELKEKGECLLRLAAEKNYPRAALVYALDQLRGGNCREGRERLLAIARETSLPDAESVFPENIKAAALRTLAIDSERRLKDIAGALEFVKRGLELVQVRNSLKLEFERRKERLEKNQQPRPEGLNLTHKKP